MEGVYLLRSNGTITSLLGNYSKNFEEEAFKEFGNTTKQFGHLFDKDFVQICDRKVFSFDVSEGTRLSFVFTKDGPPLAENPTPSQLFTVAFKSFTLKLSPKNSSSPEVEDPRAFDSNAKAIPKSVSTEGEIMSLTDLFRSSELLLRLAFDYENYVATQPNPIFPTVDWESMLGTFKDEIRIAAVRYCCTFAAELSNTETQLANAQKALKASRSLQSKQREQIDVLSEAVQKLKIDLEEAVPRKSLVSSQKFVAATGKKEPNLPVVNKLLTAEEKNPSMDKKSTDSEDGGKNDFVVRRRGDSIDSNPAAEEKSVKVTNELEKMLLASKDAIFYLQRDLEAVKLQRDSYYHQILELRRARQIYESKRHQEMTEIPPDEPPGLLKKKPKINYGVATANGKTNTLIEQAGQRKGPDLKAKFQKEET